MFAARAALPSLACRLMTDSPVVAVALNLDFNALSLNGRFKSRWMPWMTSGLPTIAA